MIALVVVGTLSAGAGAAAAKKRGVYKELPTGGQVLDGVRGPDGAMWFVVARRQSEGDTVVQRVGARDRIRSFRAPGANAIAAGPDGTLWLIRTHSVGSTKVGEEVLRMTTNGAVSSVLRRDCQREPNRPCDYLRDLVRATDGAMWVLGGLNDATDDRPPGWGFTRISRSGRVSDHLVSNFLTPSDRPGQLAAMPDGEVWFTIDRRRQRGHSVFALSDSGQLRTVGKFHALEGDYGGGLIKGPDRRLWSADRQRAERIGPSGRALRLPRSTAGARGIARLGKYMWLSKTNVPSGSGRPGPGAELQNYLLRVSRSGRVKRFKVPASQPIYGVSAGRKGTLWLQLGRSYFGRGGIPSRIARFTPPR
jgi:streptogramin lyase